MPDGEDDPDRHAGLDPLRIARVALLIRVIDADGRTLPEEREAMMTVLREAYALDSDGLARLVEAGQRADHGATDLYEHTSLIRRSTSPEERARLVEMLFEIAYADEELHEGEDATVKRIADLLGVDPRVRVDARRRVAQRHGASVIARGD